MNKTRSVSRTDKKKEEDNDALEEWDKGFTSFTTDVDSAESMFLKSLAQPAAIHDEQPAEQGQAKGKKKNVFEDLDELDTEKAVKLALQASTVISSRLAVLEALEESLKKNPHFGSSLKKCTSTMKTTLKALEADTKKAFVKKMGVNHVKGLLHKTVALLKEVTGHINLLKKL